jgi:hypothetical protein
VCPHLQEVVGSRVGLQRWAKFLAAGSSTSREFREAWAALMVEPAATWAYLEEEPPWRRLGVQCEREEPHQGGATEGG